LPYFLPEVALMVGFEQNSPHHHKDVFGHTLLVLDNVSNQLILRLAALLHDIGKPPTYSEDEKGRGHFYNHHVIGAQITQLVLSRLKYDADTVRRVSILVREHMSRFYFLRDKSTKRFINRVGVDNLDSLFELQEADIKGSKPPCDFGRLAALKNEVTKILIEKQPLTLKDLAVNGHDLRQAGVEPGERMGLILNALLEKVLETPELNTKEELLKLIKYI
ncbi:MAG: HD domain-containing protein, partial [Clostridia bacterium]|jgi:tRNA nucleotidyltransferase (CCA-adding enzyme)|nr:HD domain-containing protein [Clostridia bacterium]